jgi:hypothetical protein
MLSIEVLAIYILDIIFLLFGTIAFILSIKIFLNWDINSNTNLQYTLQRESFLVSTIIKYIFMLKMPLFLFFIFTLDKISNILTGAMCAAGVVDATSFGIYVLTLKIINIYIFGFWLVLHYLDIKTKDLIHTKIKFAFFIVIFFLLFGEILLECIMFYSIDTNKIVSCCGTLYSSASSSFISKIFLIKKPMLLSIFYGNFIILSILYIAKNSKILSIKHIFSIGNLLFLIISIISLISFFGTYIYELPTHHCPFCFLQKDYNYIGFLIYILLFIGTFYGILTAFVEKKTKLLRSYQISIIFNLLYLALVSYYPIAYYIKNSVWL